jgi:hypothetical protein
MVAVRHHAVVVPLDRDCIDSGTERRLRTATAAMVALAAMSSTLASDKPRLLIAEWSVSVRHPHRER